MNIFDILFYITIYPIQYILEVLFYFFTVYTKTPYVDALFFLSIIINILALPIYNLADKLQEKEKDIQAKLKPEIDDIKAVYKGDKRYMLIRACYRINGYKTMYAFRGTIGLLIQIPFFFAAYNFLSNLEIYNTVSLGAITSLGEPDALIKFGNISVNLLPFIMTLFSVLSTLVYTKGLTLKEKLPLFTMSGFFLIFLYNSPAVLLIYWTVNCAFSFIKNVIVLNKDKIIIYNNSVASNKNVMKVLHFSGKAIFAVYSTIVLYMTVLYFLHLKFEMIINGNNSFVEIKPYLDIKTYKDLLIIWVILSFIIALTMLNKKNVFSFINIEKKRRLPLLLLSSTLLTLLVGLFIPISLVASSSQEFENPFTLIFTSFSTYMGIFFLYPIALYFLLSDKYKNILTFLMSITALVALTNTFVMVGNYGIINPDITFDIPDVLLASSTQTIINIILMLLIVIIISIFYKKNKTKIIGNIYIVSLLALLFISIYDFTKINKEQKLLAEIERANAEALQKTGNIFNFSKDGENILIIVLDRGSPNFFDIAFERMPELKENFDGFVWYINNISTTPSSFPGTQAVYGGYEYIPYNLYTNNKNLDTKAIHNEALLVMPKLFSDLGYGATMFHPSLANLSWTPDLSIFKECTNIKAYNKKTYTVEEASLKLSEIGNKGKKDFTGIKTIRFSFFRVLPIFMRSGFYGNNDWYISSSYDNTKSGVMNTSVAEYLVLASLEDTTTIHSNGNYFNMIHSDITHEPHYFNSKYKALLYQENVAEEDVEFFESHFSAKSYYAHVASLELLSDYFNYLKENDAYDNTKIIIVSDHAEGRFTRTPFDEWDKLVETTKMHNPLTPKWYHALLLVKDFNSKDKLEISSNFMTVAEVPYLATTHLENPTNPFTGKIITNDQKNDGVVLTVVHPGFTETTYDFEYAFKVRDNIFDKNNWEEIEIK